MSDWSAWVAAKGAAVLAWYRLGESSSAGGAVDSSGNGRTLTYRTSSITYGVTGSAAGDTDTAVSIVGLSQSTTAYVAHGTSGSYLNGLGRATFIAAVKIASGTSPSFLLTSFDAAAGTNSRGFIDTNAGVARCSFYTSGGTPHAITGTTAIDDNNWRLIFGVFDGTTGTIDLYIGKLDGSVIHDGTLSVTAGSVIQTPSTDRGVTVGGRSTGTNYSTFQGFAIDEPLILNVALSPADVADAVAAWAATQLASAAMTTTSTLGASGTSERPGAASLTTVSTLVATAVRESPGSTALSTSATLGVAGDREAVDTVALSTTSTLSATGDIVPAGSGAVNFVTTSVLGADATRERPADAALTTTSTFAVVGDREAVVTAVMSTTSTLVAAATRDQSATVALVTVSTFVAAGSSFSGSIHEVGGTTTTIVVVVETGDIPTFETMELVIADPTQRRAPTAVEVILNGAESGEAIDFRIDARSEVVWTLEADQNGSIFLGSVDIPPEIGDIDAGGVVLSAGTHVLHATGATTGKDATDEFTLALSPSAYPEVQSPDIDPVEVPDRGKRWALQDPKPGGLGSWVMYPSPSSMSEPELTKTVTVDHTTSAVEGRYHISVADVGVKQWTWSGYCPDQTFYETMLSYAKLNRRFYVIDHRGRAWKTSIMRFDPVLRKRQIKDDGTPEDWAADYTVTAEVYDVNSLEPVLV